MFEKMKVGTKLYFLLGFLSALLVGAGALGLRGIDRGNASLTTIYEDRLVPAILLSAMDDLRQENIRELLQARLHDPKVPESKVHEADHPLTRHTESAEANSAKVDALLEQYLATYLTPEEKQLADDYAALRKRYHSQGQQPAIDLLKQRKFDEAGMLTVDTLMPLSDEMDRLIQKLVRLQESVARAEKDKAEADYAHIRNLAVASIAAGILLALGLGWWLIRGITARLGGSVSAISSTATEIAAAVVEHERTASQQAAAANQTSATIEELSASSRQSEEQASRAAALAEQAGNATVQGGETTRATVAAMRGLKERIAAMAEQILRLSEQSGQIGNIASLLKYLAAQINMLALNAAVEAARAGEHGKGFAVVAGEVRKLAGESKKSAEQAARLVAEIQKAANATVLSTEEGMRTVTEVTQLAGKVAELFESISGMTASVNENAQQVMLNARQQSAAFNQVVEATNSIAAGARETAAGIGQTKVGVQNLNGAAESLKAIV